jgi:predicted amidohydrolase YtcJ
MVFHFMGDGGIEHILDLIAGKEPWMDGDAPSVRLDHATLLDRDQPRRINEAKMNFGVATQVTFFFASYDSYVQNLSESQFRRSYPVKTFYDNLQHVALSSDAPATTWADPDNVFVSLKAAVDRKAYNGADIVREEAITVPQAVRLYTARAAELAPYGDVLGQIAEGFEASSIILDRDIFTIDV